MKKIKVNLSLSTLKYGPYLLLRHIWIQLVLLAAMFFLGTVVFHYYQQLDWLTSLLGSVSTITTIGIYAPNITAMPNSEKIWLVIIFIVSVGAAASLVQGIVSSLLRKELIVSEMDELKAKSLKGHVIIMGYSFLGKYVAGKLRELGLSSVVVARDETQAQLARSKGDIALVAPVAHSFEALKKAGIESACAVVVTYDHDGDNMLAIMAAKKLNPDARVITIVNEKELGEGAKAAQADVVIAPSEIMGQILAVSTVSSEIHKSYCSSVSFLLRDIWGASVLHWQDKIGSSNVDYGCHWNIYYWCCCRHYTTCGGRNLGSHRFSNGTYGKTKG